MEGTLHTAPPTYLSLCVAIPASVHDCAAMVVVLSQVLLFAERSKLSGLKRLLEAGGAVVHTSAAKCVIHNE